MDSLFSSRKTLAAQLQNTLTGITNNDRSITSVTCGKDVDDAFLNELCRELRNNRYVTSLSIKECSIDGCIDELSQLCSKTATLMSVKLSYVGLVDHYATQLLGGMLGNKSITKLCLDNNNIQDHQPIVHLLQLNRTIEVLDLSNNELGQGRDKGLMAIADTLGRNNHIKELYLSGNGMSDTAARRFLEVLDEHIMQMNLCIFDISGERSVQDKTKDALRLVVDAGRRAQKEREHQEQRELLRGNRRNTVIASPEPMTATHQGQPPSSAHMGTPQKQLGENSSEDLQQLEDQLYSARRSLDQQQQHMIALQRQLEEVRKEKDDVSKSHVQALENTTKLTQQVMEASNARDNTSRELSAMKERHETVSKQNTENMRLLAQTRKELVKAQEAAAQEKGDLLKQLRGLMEEVHETQAQLLAATKAKDFVSSKFPTLSQQPLTFDAGVATDFDPELSDPNYATPPRQKPPIPKLAMDRVANYQPLPPGQNPELQSPFISSRTASSSGAYGSESRYRPCPRHMWVRDGEVSNCFACRTEFSMFNRKHHCRVCGRVFCAKCCTMSRMDHFRVCVHCISTNNNNSPQGVGGID